MAFLNGIFGSPTPAPTPTPAAPAQQQQNSAAAPANAAPAPQNQQQAQPQGNAAAQQTPANSALDTLQQLITPSAEVLAARQAAAQNQPTGFLPTVAPDQISAALANTDFTSAIPAEQMSAALAGDPKALAAVINSAVRAGVAANVQMSHTLVEQGVRAGHDRLGSSLDSRFNEIQLRNHTPENPALQHPVAKAMVQGLARQIANANPKLTPQEANRQAEQSFLQMNQDISSAATAQTQQTQQKDVPKERDWLNYLETPQAQ